MLNIVCVGQGEGAGGYFLLLFLMLFFEFKAKYQIIFLPNKQNLEEYPIDNIVNANIFI